MNAWAEGSTRRWRWRLRTGSEGWGLSVLHFPQSSFASTLPVVAVPAEMSQQGQPAPLKAPCARHGVNHQVMCVSTWWLKCQNGPCQGSKHGELAGIGFVPMLVSSVGGTHLVCRAGGIPQGYSPYRWLLSWGCSQWTGVSPVEEKLPWHC